MDRKDVGQPNSPADARTVTNVGEMARELADITLRIDRLAKSVGIDLDAAVAAYLDGNDPARGCLFGNKRVFCQRWCITETKRDDLMQSSLETTRHVGCTLHLSMHDAVKHADMLEEHCRQWRDEPRWSHDGDAFEIFVADWLVDELRIVTHLYFDESSPLGRES